LVGISQTKAPEKEPKRIIIGVVYHFTSLQMAWVDRESGEQRLQHNEGAEKFYRELKERGVSVRIVGQKSGRRSIDC